MCKYKQKVTILLGAVQLLMLTDWDCHFIWCVCVCVNVCMYEREREIRLLFIHLWICAIRKLHLDKNNLTAFTFAAQNVFEIILL